MIKKEESRAVTTLPLGGKVSEFEFDSFFLNLLLKPLKA